MNTWVIIVVVVVIFSRQNRVPESEKQRSLRSSYLGLNTVVWTIMIKLCMCVHSSTLELDRLRRRVWVDPGQAARWVSVLVAGCWQIHGGCTVWPTKSCSLNQGAQSIVWSDKRLWRIPTADCTPRNAVHSVEARRCRDEK